MSDDGSTIDEELLRTRVTLWELRAALEVAFDGQRVPEDAGPALEAVVEQAGLPAALGRRLVEMVRLGGVIEAEPPPKDFGPAEARRFAARLALLALRRGGGPRLARAHAIAPLEPAALVERLAERVAPPTRSLQDDLLEFFAPPSFLRSILSAHRAAESRRRRAHRVTPDRYRHPLDVASADAVKRALPFEDAARRLSELIPERIFRLLNTSGNLRVGPNQIPELYELYQGCVRRLGISPEPPLFLARGGFNAFTAGVEEPFIVVNDLVVGLCTRPELEFVIGHELGHIKFDHLLYNMIAQLVRIPSALLVSVPVVGPMIGKGLELAMFEWARKAELSCDRAGLLVCQDPQAAFRVMMRMAGGPSVYASELRVETFLEQYQDLEGQWDDLLSSLFYILSTMERSHPWTVVRAHELSVWIDEGAYDGLLAECPPETPHEPEVDLEQALEALAGEPPLRDALQQLARQCRTVGLPPFMAEALDALAAEDPAANPLAVAVGARYRGRSRLVEALRPALEGVTLLDTPDLDEDAARFNAEALPALLRAQVVVVALSAAQLLSDDERQVISSLLRLLDAPAALAVGRMDVVETPEDDRDVRARVARFAEGFESAEVFILDGDDAADALTRWVHQACAWDADRAEERWQARVDRALRALEGLCEVDEDGPATLDQDLTRLRGALRAEHDAALAEARGVLKQGFAGLRAEAPGWFDALDVEARRHEGVARLISQVGEVGDRAGRHYLRTLEGHLAEYGPEPLARSVDALEQTLASHTESALLDGLPDPELERRSRTKSPRAIAAALGTLALGAMFVPGAPVWAAAAGLGVGAASLLASHDARAQRERQLLQGHREQLLTWLDDAEHKLDARLERVGAACLEALLARVAQVHTAERVHLMPEGGQRLVGAAAVALRRRLAGGGEE
ncbi:MAG: M48 family metalloprotease [Alphaproteobacteria bacterium]|nr:M48 family metalloprotease [Alphaproteobacteria bacterium]